MRALFLIADSKVWMAQVPAVKASQLVAALKVVRKVGERAWLEDWKYVELTCVEGHLYDLYLINAKGSKPQPSLLFLVDADGVYVGACGQLPGILNRSSIAKAISFYEQHRRTS